MSSSSRFSPTSWWREPWLIAAVGLQLVIWGGLFQLRFEVGEWQRMRDALPVNPTTEDWYHQIVDTHGAGGLAVVWFDMHKEVQLYHHYARILTSAEQAAYRDVPMEYQPGALAVLLPPAWVSSDYEGYVTAFVWWCGFLHVMALGLALMWWQDGRPWSAEIVGRAGVLGAVFLLAFGGVAAARFDHVVPVLVGGSLLLLRRAERSDAWGLYALGGALVAVGVLTKIVPGASLAVVVAWLIWERPQRWPGKIAALVGGFGGALLGLHGWFFWLWGQAYLDSYTYHAERGIQFESTWAGVMRLVGPIEVVRDYGAHHLVTAATGTVKLLSLGTFGVFAFVWLVRAKGAISGWLPAVLGLLLATIVTSTVLSPQYLLWLGAPVMAATAVNRAWWPSAVLLLFAAGLSQVLVPHLYDALVAGKTTALLVLNLRNGILVTLLVWLWWRQPRLRASA